MMHSKNPESPYGLGESRNVTRALVVFGGMETTLATGCCAAAGSPFAALLAGLAGLVVLVVVIARWFERRRWDRLARWPVGSLADRSGREEEP